MSDEQPGADPATDRPVVDRGGTVSFEVDGRAVEVTSGATLLEVLRSELGVHSAKDGCSPQGQCGCCTVWVDGAPRVACVTPVARVAGRSVTTVDHLPDVEVWAEAFARSGASQCGFCTPGIIARVAALAPAKRRDPTQVRRALSAHLCRCTGWEPIVDAVADAHRRLDRAGGGSVGVEVRTPSDRARRRARLEGGVDQDLGSPVALGRGGFADDRAPADALVAVLRAGSADPSDPDAWVVAPTLAVARERSGKIQGRRTTAPVSWPIELPPGTWDRTLRTTWVEPGYLEPDASWCEPGGEPASPLGNGGAFGGKVASPLPELARMLADRHDVAVRVVWSREDVVRFGPKRPPIAAGMDRDGSGVLRVARTPGIADAIAIAAPGLEVVEVDVDGPPTSAEVRAAGWAEAAVLLASLDPGAPSDTADAGADRVESPDGAVATARIDDDGAVHVTVRSGADPDDPDEAVVIRSYATGAAHMALGWVRSEAISVDGSGVPQDLTIRSFGILRAVDTPRIHVTVASATSTQQPAVRGADAVFAAVAAAAWRRSGFVPAWPVVALPSRT